MENAVKALSEVESGLFSNISVLMGNNSFFLPYAMVVSGFTTTGLVVEIISRPSGSFGTGVVFRNDDQGIFILFPPSRIRETLIGAEILSSL